MLQETVSKEAELREKLCSVQSENMMMKSEHAQTVSQLTSQNEALRNSFRDQTRHLQEEHRKTMETLQQQLSKVEAQLFQLKSEPTTRKPPLWHAELTKEELVQKLSSTTKSADHLNGLLRETEATNAILMEQIKVLVEMAEMA
ncbi:PREDICTED: GRIP and coiled-coil domain-containing protein 2 [Hipposideros armiger]|uniref:GRIP and coiled-coil domain-containing protein 2 n=1 Tax=Hipposideros armiger TaxID=186990 RepID=A0A8B7T2Q9_HIPAR|nr:PREDICTED: GRIP and coiled-coil domain-containing protein 2 [Hipposideros armiger]